MDQSGGLEVSSSSDGVPDVGGGVIGGGGGGQPTQITSIDGFFNRKRGRPPKNRFVEVYKSAQHSPQAIFTSFKLERNEQNLGSTTTTTILVPNESGFMEDPVTDLTSPPNSNRSRKKCRLTETTRSQVMAHERQEQVQGFSKESTVTMDRSPLTPPQTISPALLMAPSKRTSCKILERVSVVRAAGTFYPENATSSPAMPSQSLQETTLADQPEDLSMRPTPTTTTTATSQPISHHNPPRTPPTQPQANQGNGLNLVQFKQLIDLYQRQVLLPSFLAAASQSQNNPIPSMDMRLLLENAAQQKLMLINAAATAAAAAAAASAAATSNAPNQTLTQVPAMPRATTKRTRVEDIPTGYLKFRFNEDCSFEQCGYRNHQSHFHCNRRDCHYSFCDKTRFVQHTARHERMDTLMGDDFQQYRANMQCGMANCCYATATATAEDSLDAVVHKKSSHFHCRKCDYVCTDSNKVVAHRRLHLRLEYVRAAGFRKVASNEICDSSTTCSYALRHTHYHCVTCDGSVLSRAQLASHKHRTTTTTTTTATTTMSMATTSSISKDLLNADDKEQGIIGATSSSSSSNSQHMAK
ncbi:uncharacterized protein LOC6639313 [Drosophila willistoni]|uniref:uncharacterized protein LOC6639313 n=1 Tax=Drosophila willistoni TaxID=7260 RepID=UPI00017D6723|nr:uncharacterized protein LOC6639313 [Drosophila willistoni]XP_046867993.1 uncharacterized protein LOC6639313 [Drosophila willistoni]